MFVEDLDEATNEDPQVEDISADLISFNEIRSTVDLNGDMASQHDNFMNNVNVNMVDLRNRFKMCDGDQSHISQS